MNYFECCQICTERHVGCHSSCEKYKNARENYDSMVQRRKDFVNERAFLKSVGEYYRSRCQKKQKNAIRRPRAGNLP